MDRPNTSSASLRPPQTRSVDTPPPQKAPTALDDMSICASNTSDFVSTPPRRKHGKDKPQSLGAWLRRGIVEHQLGLSINLMLLVALSYLLFPAMRERMTAFFYLSYPSPSRPGMYGQGIRDLAFVASFIVVFTALRAFCLDYVLHPISKRIGIRKKKDEVRFAEQTYMMLYYGVYWTGGLILFIRETPHDVRSVNQLLISLWTGFPRLYLSAWMKFYYLSQLAFWIQQVAVIHIEERRKDHWQMFAHHIITIGLLSFSYPYRQWRVGNAVLVCMDVIDCIFPLAKILKYLDLQTACDAAFAAFVVFWVIGRHVFYGAICWSIWAHVAAPGIMEYGVYSTASGARISSSGGKEIVDNILQPILHPGAATVSFNANIRWLFLGMLLALQCITIGWFIMICRVVVRVLRGEGADDTRSDAEDEEVGLDDDDEKETLAKSSEDLPAQPSDHTAIPLTLTPAKPRYIEVEATGEDVRPSYAKRKVSTGTGVKRKSKGISSGLNLGERKEILNRIGCLSEEQLAREREKREESGGRGPSRPGSATGRR